MASIDRYRPPPREGYQPPSLPPKPPTRLEDRLSKSPSRRRDVPPAVPSPPTHTSRTSPPRPSSRRSMPESTVARADTPPRHRASQWYFTADEALSSPSILEGITPVEERLRRAKGVNFIYQAGVLLDLPQITLWVAGVFFHRFYMRYSMLEENGGIHHYNIAATALFLANKTEENCRKTKDLIIAVAKVAQKNSKLIIDEQSKEYWRWRDSILMYEELMLELLTFDLMVDNPYQQLFDHLRQLELVHNKRIREAAWAFCNDACLTVLPLLMEARDVAVGALFFASTVTGNKIDDVNGEAWWKALRGDEARLIKSVEVMSDFYAENPLRKQESRLNGSPEFNLENTRRRGETFASQTEAGSSQNATPLDFDRGTQSPRPQSNGGRADGRDGWAANGNTRKDDERSGSVDPNPNAARGDSDVALKQMANDLDRYEGKPDGPRLPSPGIKRKEYSLEDDEAERESKKPRRSSVSELVN